MQGSTSVVTSMASPVASHRALTPMFIYVTLLFSLWYAVVTSYPAALLSRAIHTAGRVAAYLSIRPSYTVGDTTLLMSSVLCTDTATTSSGNLRASASVATRPTGQCQHHMAA